MPELEQLCVCWEVPFARIREAGALYINHYGILSLMEPQMKHLSFSIFLEIFLLNWVEMKLNPSTHFRACIGACLDL